MADKWLLEKLGSDKYDPQQHVQEISRESVGLDDLLRYKQTIQSLADDTSGQLKRNVYKNYTQFIETAKEIAYLESEMYQLSHILTEHRTLLATLLETSVLGGKSRNTITEGSDDHKVEDQKHPKKALTSLLEKVEGCASIVDVPGRHLIHHGELLEHDPNTFGRINRVHAFLLNDSVVFATWMGNRVGPVKYKFQVLYELDALPVVNVRDLPEVKNAFKILMFPEARLFVCDNGKVKKEWLEKIEATKKANRSADTVRRESQHEVAQSKEDPVDTSPFVEDNSDDSKKNEDENHNLSFEIDTVPEWMIELPEDLDVCIAQRDFEEATNLIERAIEFINNHSCIQQIKDMRRRIDHRVKLLTKELENEITISPDKSLQGGPRAARRAVSLLVRLGKSAQACNLFLKHHSALIKHSMKQLKIEGETRLYVRRLCNVFFMHIMDTCNNLEQSFPSLPSTRCALVVWVCDELKAFAATFSRQIFTQQVSLSLVADCIAVARQHCDQLSDLGMDITFFLNNLLHLDVERLFMEAREKLLEAIKLRSTEDKWRPLNLQSKTGLEKFLDDMKDIGITNMQSYICDDCWIGLTSNTIYFSKAYLNFVDDSLKLHTNEIHSMVERSIYDIIRAQMKHVELCAKNEKFKNEVAFIQKNGLFLFTTVLPLTEKKYEDKLGYNCILLSKLRHSYSWLTGSSSVTKYSSTGFL